MIILDLACKQQHSFEGWFQSLHIYESQVAKGLIACPQCGSNDIHRIPSALHVATRSNSSATSKPRVPAAGLVGLQQVISAIIDKCEDVGNDFAQEARKMHYEETPHRPIRGTASDDEYEGLRDEGIEVLRLPVVKKEDLN